MSITNGYATLADFMAMPEITSADAVDDVFVEQVIERASRAIDAFCQTWFYADTQTRYFNLPRSRQLKVDVPLLSVTTLTNGDGATIPSTDFFLGPYNGPNHEYLELLPISSYFWQPSLTYLDKRAVTVVGSWGYVDRTATDPESTAAILNTTNACLSIALSVYKKRYGQGVEGVAQVTGAGVVITPRGIPAEAKLLLAPYVNVL